MIRMGHTCTRHCRPECQCDWFLLPAQDGGGNNINKHSNIHTQKKKCNAITANILRIQSRMQTQSARTHVLVHKKISPTTGNNRLSCRRPNRRIYDNAPRRIQISHSGESSHTHARTHTAILKIITHAQRMRPSPELEPLSGERHGFMAFDLARTRHTDESCPPAPKHVMADRAAVGITSNLCADVCGRYLACSFIPPGRRSARPSVPNC